MNVRNTGLAAAALSAALAFGWSSQAHAGAVAYSHLNIFNFTLTKAGGAPLLPGDFSIAPNPANSTSAQANLDPFAGVNAQNSSDVPLQCLGNCGGFVNNQFGRTTPSFTQASFSRADAVLIGSVLTGGANAEGVAEVQLTGDYPNTQTTSSTIGTNATFTFTPSNDVTIEANFSAVAELYAETDDKGGLPFAEIGFKITLRRNDTQQQVFSWTPDGTDGNVTGLIETVDECNLNTNIGTGGPGQTASYSPTDAGADAPDGTCDFSGQVALLGGISYTLVITQTQVATATSVVEPGTMALLASGLLGLGAVARRRRK